MKELQQHPSTGVCGGCAHNEGGSCASGGGCGKSNPWLWRVIGFLILSLIAAAAVRTEAAESGPFVEEVYLTRDEALQQVFAGANWQTARFSLDEAQAHRISKAIGRRLDMPRGQLLRARQADETQGYALIVEEIGKYKPITFMVAARPDGGIEDVAVMVYRETRGAEVKRTRFLSQYQGKSLADPIRLNRDIINISGATLSVRAISRGVRKALALMDFLVMRNGSGSTLEWEPLAVEHSRAPRDANEPLKRARYRMGTLLEMTAYGPHTQVQRAFDAAFAEVARLEALMSTWRTDSEISRLNRAEVREPVALSPATFECLSASLELARQTGGAFDPTRKPEGYRAIRIDGPGHTARRLRADVDIDLGGIGKGCALDRAAQVLRERGIERSLLNFGGQVLALAPPTDHSSWLVGVRDPARPEELLGLYELQSGSISTSAGYERGAHIIDPHTGHPAQTAVSVSVWSPDATRADGTSTALSVMRQAEGEALIEHSKRYAALIVSAHGATPREYHHADGPVFLPAKN